MRRFFSFIALFIGIGLFVLSAGSTAAEAADVSVGMNRILEDIFGALNVKKGINKCQIAAINQAGTIAQNAKSQRVLGGAASIVFDLLTS